ncbi:hypothetical protein DL93DRAFT_1996343 [Clavulina sp. PMI_390]|nr:hypothetical protein DL93DRAFT_1996343 [Clavulina sp. PMI_390]
MPVLSGCIVGGIIAWSMMTAPVAVALSASPASQKRRNRHKTLEKSLESISNLHIQPHVLARENHDRLAVRSEAHFSYYQSRTSTLQYGRKFDSGYYESKVFSMSSSGKRARHRRERSRWYLEVTAASSSSIDGYHSDDESMPSEMTLVPDSMCNRDRESRNPRELVDYLNSDIELSDDQCAPSRFDSLPNLSKEDFGISGVPSFACNLTDSPVEFTCTSNLGQFARLAAVRASGVISSSLVSSHNSLSADSGESDNELESDDEDRISGLELLGSPVFACRSYLKACQRRRNRVSVDAGSTFSSTITTPSSSRAESPCMLDEKQQLTEHAHPHGCLPCTDNFVSKSPVIESLDDGSIASPLPRDLRIQLLSTEPRRESSSPPLVNTLSSSTPPSSTDAEEMTATFKSLADDIRGFMAKSRSTTWPIPSAKTWPRPWADREKRVTVRSMVDGNGNNELV